MMKRSMNALSILLVCCGFLTGCQNGTSAAREVTLPHNYGNGVYYFPAEGAEFGRSLSKFIETHSELEIVTMTGAEPHGHTQGYFAVFRKKSI